ncbi:MAG: universal stress protein [Polyangiales bacterium]|jgi:nucleotide-binding universal stress UspA family protein
MKPLIVVCTDFSPCSELALQRAADIARRDETRVFIIHTFDPKKVKGPAAHAPTERDRRAWDEDSMRLLKEARHRYFGHLEDTDVQYDALPCASPSVEICRVANETKASLIVLGSHGRTGVMRRLVGSVAENTVRHAPCSVFVVRDQVAPAS